MISFPEVPPLVIIIVIVLAAIAKFYHAARNKSWLAFADGMGRLGLGAAYLVLYVASLNGGSAAGSDQQRAEVRLVIVSLFLIEAIPWIVGLFRREKKP
jgi:hypothetical protein